MTEYWREHSKEGSVNEMMLDTAAEELTKEEVPEILSYLPDWTGKTVLELGAGIGRFTAELAKTAEKVLAVDFMEDFIEINKTTNSCYSNIDYIVTDVTKLEIPEESVDLIFSNWLFMYLEDMEAQELMKKQLSWLKPGGHIFMRESCKHQSGDKNRGANPTQYRDPELYEAFYSSIALPCDEENFYGYDLVFSKSVDTYIKDFVEMLDLKEGQRVLDVGGGIGGSAFYMAKTFGAKVTIVDLSSNMIQIGMERAQEVGCGPDQVVFERTDATKRDYPPASFR
ncbi:unnamed protein product, partial [Candidula unifasciata]